jgi:GntR family transcriptional regulator
MIEIATGDSRSIGKQITDGVRMKIATGDLQTGMQLPSVRGLAQQLTINANTVAKAYAELTAEGWLESRQGLGLFVAPSRQRLSGTERDKRFEQALSHFVHEVVALDMAVDEVLSRLDHKLRAFATKKSA